MTPQEQYAQDYRSRVERRYLTDAVFYARVNVVRDLFDLDRDATMVAALGLAMADVNPLTGEFDG